jgi:AAA ATPase domain
MTIPGSGAGASNRPRVPTVSPPFRGRTEHAALIADLIADLRRGEGSVLLIEGPPGIGKSRLVDEVGTRATHAGVQAFTGKGYEDQQAVPFAPLFEAILSTDPPICDPAALSLNPWTVGRW